MEASTYRWASEEDFPALADVMFEAVRTGPSPYTETQRAAWVPAPRSGASWSDRLRGQRIILAECERRVLGFMSLAADGYIDFAYIRPQDRGKGIFRALYSHILVFAQAAHESRLWVHASVMAQPAFASLGFREVQKERVRIGDQDFDRALMEKHL